MTAIHNRRKVLWLTCALLGVVLVGLVFHLAHAQSGAKAPDKVRLLVFAGAASQPATSEAAKAFTDQTGVQVDCSFGGSGTMLNQIRMEHFGDLYIPGSDNYMDKAEADKLVDASTRQAICWLLPVICVPKGNPKHVKGLADLTQDGIRVAIGDPKSVCLGTIAKAAMEKAGLYDKVAPHIVTYAADCQEIASLIRLGEVDAAIGYDVFQTQSPDEMDCVPIQGAQTVSVPVAVVPYTKHRKLALQFAAFIAGPEGKKIFAKHGYTVEKP